MTMKEVRLNNGVIMPAIGFGVFQIPENETERVVTDALEAGGLFQRETGRRCHTAQRAETRRFVRYHQTMGAGL